MKNPPPLFSTAIIGAGPIGLELAACLNSKGVRYIQFDKGQIGETVTHYPPQTRFFSSSERIALEGKPIQTNTQEKCTKEEYLAYLRAYALENKLSTHTFEEVVDIAKDEDVFEITTAKQKYFSRTVVIATGGLAFHRKLNVPGEDFPFVFETLPDPHLFFQKRVLVVGGKNSAVEAALRLFHAGAHVAIAVRDEKFSEKEVKYWLLPELLGRIERGEIQCYYHTSVKAISEGEVLLIREGAAVCVPIDFVIKAIGFEADLSLIKKLGVEFNKEGKPQFSEDTMETNVKGVYLLGTVVGGTQKEFKLFIENCHIHVEKVLYGLSHSLHLPTRVTSHVNEMPSARPEE